MCGIAGFVDYSNRVSEQFLSESLRLLKHRGPDDAGTYYYKNDSVSIGLGNARLAIIDLSLNGHQPFKSSCSNYVLVFNGTIYNYKELKLELQHRGIEFNSDSDTEVLLQAYIYWQDEFLQKLNGIFAFSIFDKKKNKLILCRDKIGVKPLFYYFDNKTLIFGSELRVFIKQNIFPVEIGQSSLNQYLQYAYFPQCQTILKNVRKVNPGQIVSLNLSTKSLESKFYWRLNTNLPNSFPSSLDLEFLHEKLVTSIKSRLTADVPAGILLSGGYDSSTVAAIAQKHSSNRLKTFTIGFNEVNYNEATEAEKIANHIGTEHYSLFFDNNSIKDLITTVGKTFDEPMGDSGAIPLLLAAKLAKAHVKVVLSAEGGDELFGGYTSYFKALSLSKFSGYIPKKIATNRYLNILSQKNSFDVYRAMGMYFTETEARLLTNVTAINNTHSSDRDELNQLLDFDLQNYLPNDLLMKADRSMMHYGLENRDPLLDTALVDYVTALPGIIKCPNQNAKALLKEIAYKYIPKGLLDRPKKGFSMPVGKWLSQNLNSFTEEKIKHLSQRGILDGNYIMKIYQKFKSKPGSYYSRQIWILLAFELWMEEWID